MRALFLALALLLLPAAARAAQAPQVVTSEGGITAWLIEDHDIPTLAMSFAFRGSTGEDPPGREGATWFLSDMLTEGVGPYDAKSFYKLLDDHSVKISYGTGRDWFQGSLYTLSRNRDVALEYLKLSLTAPRLDADDFRRERDALQSQLRRSMTDPNWQAWRNFLDIAFPDHPYGRPGHGLPETLARVSIDDLKALKRRIMVRDRLLVGVAGDITAAELGPVLDQLFGELPLADAPLAARPVTMAGGGTVALLDRDLPQTLLVAGLPGITRDDPDWYAAQLVNYVLGGGGFASRLMTEIREKRGLTYGIFSGLIDFEDAGLVTIQGSFRNPVTGQALDLVRAELDRIAQGGLTEKELAEAKSYITGAFALGLTSARGVAGMLLQIQQDGQGPDFIEKRNDIYDAVTLADAARVAHRLMGAGGMLAVMVGRPEGVTATRTLESHD